jgi:hypothetical protein
MIERMGFIQHRLSSMVNGKIQTFQWDIWSQEIKVAKIIDISNMEWMPMSCKPETSLDEYQSLKSSNKWVRFSKEIMLLSSAQKPLSSKGPDHVEL